MNTFARIESACTFRDGLSFHVKSISLIRQIELLNAANKNQLFQFNGNLYEQTDGVAMGSPLGPLLANVFMYFIEDKLNQDGKLPPINEDMWMTHLPSCLI